MWPTMSNENVTFTTSLPHLHIPFASLPSVLESRRRAHEAQRQIMEDQRESLRAAGRSISLLREQIRLHDERARLSISSLEPSPPPIDGPTQTSAPPQTQLPSSSGRDTLQEHIRREQSRHYSIENSIRSIGNRTETERPLEEVNLIINPPLSNSSLRLPNNQPELNLNACPIPTYSIVTSTHTSYLVRESSDRWIVGNRPGDNTVSPSPPLSVERFSNQDDHNEPRGRRHDSFQEVLLEREWERQLVDGEVDINGEPTLRNQQEITSINPPLPPPYLIRNQSPGFTRTHRGTLNVDGLGLQLANISNPQSTESLPDSNDVAFHPQCLR